MDNLFAAKKLAIGAKSHVRRKCDIHEVSRDSSQGFPSEILMDNPKKNTARNSLVGTTKAAVFKSVENCPDIVAFAVFDQNSVCFLSTVVDKLVWEMQVRKMHKK